MISRLRPLQALRLTRPYSTTPKPANLTSQFYKTFTRPVSKVILTAVFTYQVVYWSWLKLEADEKRTETDAEIRDLEKTVNEYESKRKEKK